VTALRTSKTKNGLVTKKTSAPTPVASAKPAIALRSCRARSAAPARSGSPTSPAVYLKATASPTAAPAKANQRRPPSSLARTAP
jgi:hypothetical protein